jgi:hypothetical protein
VGHQKINTFNLHDNNLAYRFLKRYFHYGFEALNVMRNFSIRVLLSIELEGFTKVKYITMLYLRVLTTDYVRPQADIWHNDGDTVLLVNLY